MTFNEKFKKFLATEDYGGHPVQSPPATGYQSIDGPERGAFNFANPEYLDGLNFYLHQLSKSPYLNPYGILQQVRGKLNLIGLDFDKPLFVGDKGVVAMPLKGWGGRTGYLDNKGTIGTDDGISHILPGGLKIVFTFEKTNGQYYLSVKAEKGQVDGDGPIYDSHPSFPHDTVVGPVKESTTLHVLKTPYKPATKDQMHDELANRGFSGPHHDWEGSHYRKGDHAIFAGDYHFEAQKNGKTVATSGSVPPHKHGYECAVDYVKRRDL